MTLQAQIKWVTNLADFKKSIEEGTGAVVAHTAKVDKLTQSLGGSGLLGAANNYVAAVERMGGVEKLTAAEKERINGLLVKALDKYEALGRAAPEAMRKLAEQTQGVAKPLNASTEIANRLKGALLAAFTVTAVKSAVSSFLEFTSSLTDMSLKTGISTTELQKLKYAAEQNGGTLDQVTGGITKMGKALVEGDASTVQAMKRLGLSITDVRNMAPGEAFATIADKIARIPNPLERSKIQLDIFGKAGADLLPMMTGNLSETMKAAEKLGIVLDEKTVAAGDNLGDTLSSLQGVGMAVLGKLLAPMLPAFQMVANAMLSTGNIVDYLRGMFDALARVGLIAIKALVDGAIAVGQFAAKVPGLSRVIGDDAAAMQGMRDASTWLGGAIKGLEQSTDTAAVTTKKMAAPVVELTKAQRDQADATDAVRRALIPLTSAQQQEALANQQLGITAEMTAKKLGISATAVTTYLDSVKNAKDIAEIWGDAHEKMLDVSEKFIRKAVDDWQAGQQKMADASGKALADQLQAYAEYEEKNYQATLTGTQLTIRQIELERDAKIAALTKQFDVQGPLYAAASAQITAYYQNQINLANGTANTIEQRMRAQGVATRADLVLSATNAKRDYEQMKASGLYSAAAIEQAWQRMVDATIATNGELALSTGDLFRVIARQAQEAFTRGGWQGLKDFAKQTAMDFATGMVAAIPVVGPILSKFVAPIAKILGGLFGTAGRKAVEDFAKSFGGFDVLQAKLLQLGAAGEQLWIKLTQGVPKGDPAKAKQVIDEITKAFAAQEAQIASNNESLAGLLQQLQAAGATLPQSFQGAIDALTKTGQLTAENAALMQQLMGETTVDTAKMEEVAKKYNLSLDQLGPTFRKQKLNESFQELIDDMDLLTRGGADVNAMLTTVGANGQLALSGVGEQVQNLVRQSIQLGTDIPENMKPWIARLIESGLLLDANGNKITDINTLKFGESLQTSVQKLVEAIQALIDKMSAVPKALDKIPNRKTIDIEWRGKKTGEWPTGSKDPTGGFEPPPTFHTGTAKVLSFPTVVAHRGLLPDEIPAILQTGEAVLNRRAVAAVGSPAIGALNRGGGLRSEAAELMAREVRGLREDLSDQRQRADHDRRFILRQLPNMIEAAVRKGAA